MRMLLLAGTPEAVQIARALAREERVIATASLARATRRPALLGIPTRIGGWGSTAAFAEWISREGIEAVLDATHPFANRISLRSATVCRDLGVGYIQFLRPQAKPGPDDTWYFLNNEEETAGHIPTPSRIYLATGQRAIERFGPLPSATVHVRITEEPTHAFPFEAGNFILRPEHATLGSEEALLFSLGTDWVVARNTGGMATQSVLEAARRLGLPVAMIRRPPQPEAHRIQTVAAALAWVRRRL
ncbi:MAG: precorrin-6A/cobalt-precorrin-6A reductase [Pseudomonadota bacterium]